MHNLATLGVPNVSFPIYARCAAAYYRIAQQQQSYIIASWNPSAARGIGLFIIEAHRTHTNSTLSWAV